MKTYAVKSVTEDDRPADRRVVQRLHAHVVASAEEAAPSGVPDAKCEIADQGLDAGLLPDVVRVPQELDVRTIAGDLSSLRHELGDQIAARVDARVRDDPGVAVQ